MRRLLPIFAVVLISQMALANTAKATFVIDEFTSPMGGQSALSVGAGSDTDFVDITSGTDLPGTVERDIGITATGGTTILSANVTPGVFGYSFTGGGGGATSSFFVDWDGDDNDATTQGVGLGGVDLATGNLGIFFKDVIGSSSSGDFILHLTMYTGSLANFSTAVINLGTVYGTVMTPIDVFVPFTDFTVIGGLGADFSDVDSIRLARPAGGNATFDVEGGIFAGNPVPEPFSLAAWLGVAGVAGALGLRKRSRAAVV